MGISDAIFLKDTLTIEDEKLFKACRSVCFPEPSDVRYPLSKCENLHERLLQNYKAQRHAVFIKDTLFIEGEKLFKAF